jgi:glycosyltransferase involved in cell wall biosynthesis
MSFQFSIIIICRNEAANIEAALNSILLLSDDVVVYDSGSTDGTLELLQKFPIRLVTGPWEGFGSTRQKAALLSKYDWVLIVDADEVVSPQLATELAEWKAPNTPTAYSIQLHNHIGAVHLCHGTWGHDFRVRLYNRHQARWSDARVHEKLILPEGMAIIPLHYTIRHNTARNMDELAKKLDRYATLTAEEYYRQGKRSTWIKRNLGPLFAFIKSFFLKLGFLDGSAGYHLAHTIARYTRSKYYRLHRLEQSAN